jgi:hypothetical protein
MKPRKIEPHESALNKKRDKRAIQNLKSKMDKVLQSPHQSSTRGNNSLMTHPRYLTKSRFKLGRECPTKLFYTNKKEYANQKLDDPFLMALANGGFQVGELAKCYFPGGVEISTLDYEESLRQTAELLERDCVTIFEAAFRYNNFFIRPDILIKNGDALELIEVKAKSCDFTDETGCWNRNGTIASAWIPYIEDVAFQKYVVEKSTGLPVKAHLMLSSKDVTCATDGLNQKFRIVTRDGRKGVIVSPDLCDADLATPILRPICVDQSCDKVYGPRSGAETRPVGSVPTAEDQAETRPVGSMSDEAETRPVGSVFNEAETRTVGSVSDEAETRPVGSVSNEAETRPVGSVSKEAETRPVGSVPDEAETRPVGSVSNEAETRPVGSVSDEDSFEQLLQHLADHYASDEKILTAPSSVCSDCEFRHGENDTDLKSGFRECWTTAFNWQDSDFDEHTVLDLWDFRRKDDLIAAGKVKMAHVAPEDIAPKTKPKGDPKPGFSNTDRQWMQIRKAVDRDHTPHIYADDLKREMDSWTFPLHFIDFETAAPVIPFKRGRRPYEGLAFQFSHHTVDETGNVEHRGEYLNAVPGGFPSYDLVRELKNQLENDSGTIFRYHSHENSYLCSIREQMLRDPDAPPDRDDLVAFIERIAKPRSAKDHPEDDWTAGPRNMVDLYEMVKRYYYHPATRGSISLKYVLPAVLSTSEFLQEKYSQPIYGAEGGLRSLNFKDQRWVVFPGANPQSEIPDPKSLVGSPPSEGGMAAASADGVVLPSSANKTSPIDPYKLLPKLFTDESARDYEIIFEQDRISDGGAAMTAYGKLQFQEMSDPERSAIESALLKYCELDTLAMVMIYEAWKAELG